jgi:hypothetical protein
MKLVALLFIALTLSSCAASKAFMSNCEKLADGTYACEE